MHKTDLFTVMGIKKLKIQERRRREKWKLTDRSVVLEKDGCDRERKKRDEPPLQEGSLVHHNETESTNGFCGVGVGKVNRGEDSEQEKIPACWL